MIKSLFRLSLRMVTGFVQSLIKLCGLNWTAPDYTTLCRRKKHIDIAISYQSSSLERNELLRTVTRLGRTLWKNGQAIIGEVWLKLRCTALNY